MNHGLSQNGINCVIQDSSGFMWIGTQDGLNRYDGIEFKIYCKVDGDETSLNNNYIWCLYEDSAGYIWVGTFGGGLSRYNPKNDSFLNFISDDQNENSLSNDRVTSIIEFPTGTFWIGTDNGLNKFEFQKKKFTRYFLEKNTNQTEDEITYNRISSINHYSGDLIWMISNDGLTSLDSYTIEIKIHKNSPFDEKLNFGKIYGLCKDNSHALVCCDEGLVELDFENSISTVIFNKKYIGDWRKHTNSIFAFKDKDNFYWLSTGDELILFDKNKKEFQKISNNKNNQEALSSNCINSICQSKDGVLWFATRNGLDKLDSVENNFELVKHRLDDSNSLGNQSQTAILVDRLGRVWVGSQKCLTIYLPDKNKYYRIFGSKEKPGSIYSDYILSLMEDREGKIWIGTRNGGLSLAIIPDNGNIANITFKNFINEDSWSPETIHYIIEDEAGIIWLGTAGHGLTRFDNLTGDFKSYPCEHNGAGPSHPFIYCIKEDSKGNFWLGCANGGVNMFDKESGKFLYITHDPEDSQSLSNNIILCVFEDSGNNVWIGTTAGLNKLTFPLEENLFTKFRDGIVKPVFKKFGTQQGFPNEVIYGILEDSEGYLWLSTNAGIVKFNPVNEIVLKTFNVHDGLQSNEFNQNSFCKSPDGKMYFGGVEGLNFFYPEKITGNKFVPELSFTDFSLFNESVPINQSGKYSLHQSIRFTRRIHLAYNQNVISFKFSALSFISPEKNQYAYMMEGFDSDWIFAGKKNEVTYTNLDHGNYEFKVKACNNDGVWNDKGISISLNISPPPWRRWYAYLSYTSFIAAAGISFVRNRIKSATREMEVKSKIEKAKVEERENVRRKSSADFHDEAGNKITKISLFTELAKRDASGNPALIDYLNKIEENTQELSSGMRDFIWVLDPEKDSLFNTINRIKDFGNSFFDYSNINFSAKGISEGLSKIVLSMEQRRALMLIFKEAINNIHKHAMAENVLLKVMVLDNDFQISLSDDGVGFTNIPNERCYGLKNMQGRAEKIKGILDIESSKNSGTLITFKSKITQMGN